MLDSLDDAERREVVAAGKSRIPQLFPSHVRLLDQARLEALAAAGGLPQQNPGKR